VNGEAESDWRLIYADRMASASSSLLLLLTLHHEHNGDWLIVAAVELDDVEFSPASDAAMCIYIDLDLFV